MASAETWIGFEVDDLNGDRVGSVSGVFLDAESGEPAWLIAGLGRRRVKPVAIPLANCAAGTGRVWVAHDRGALNAAPTVDPSRPLLREHELAICSQYGISERVGRAAEVVSRPEGSTTSKPR